MTPLDRSRLVARLFTRPVLEAVARRGGGRDLVDKLLKLGIGEPTECCTLANLMDAGLEQLGRDYRCEYVYKAAIANRIIFGRHSPRTANLAIELPVDGSIVDAAIFNGTSTAYEIKTEFDSPVRLTTQTPSYLRAFDSVNLVTHPALVDRYIQLLDSRVGIYALNADNSLSLKRAAVSDVSRVEPGVVFRMLRRAEYMTAVRKHFGPQPELPNGLIAAHYRALFTQLTSEQAHKALVGAMRSRTTDPDTSSFLAALPKSLRALGYATPLSPPQRARLLSALSTPA